MTSTGKVASHFQCVIKLAPFAKSTKKEDYHLNSETAFRITIDPTEGSKLTVASALRLFLEESCCSCFLPRVCNRALKGENGDTAVELNYGDGYKTFVKSQNASAVKSVKQIGIFLHMGELEKESTQSQVIVSPTDYLFNHVESKMREKGKLDDDTPLVLSIFTGCLLFHSPKHPSREGSIELYVPPSELGYYTNGLFDGERKPYPTQLIESSTKKSTKEAIVEKKDEKETPGKKSNHSSSLSHEQKKSDSNKSSENKTPIKRKRKSKSKAVNEKEKEETKEPPPQKKSKDSSTPLTSPVPPGGNVKVQKKAEVQEANKKAEKKSKHPEKETSTPKKSSSGAKKDTTRSAKKTPHKRATSDRKAKIKASNRASPRKKRTK